METEKEIAYLREQLEQERTARISAQKLAESQYNIIEAVINQKFITDRISSENSPASLLFTFHKNGNLESLNLDGQQFLQQLSEKCKTSLISFLQQNTSQLGNNAYLSLEASVEGSHYNILILQMQDKEFFTVYLSDITDKHNTQLELKESQNFVNNIAHTIPNIIYIYDLEENRSIYLNKHIKSILGYNDTEVVSITEDLLKTLVLPKDTMKLHRHVHSLRKAVDGNILKTEYSVKCKDGTIKNLFCRESVFKRDEKGRVKQIIGSAEDVTNLRAKSEELLQQKNFYESILNHIPSDVAVFNKQLQYVFLNPKAILSPELRRWIIGKTNTEYGMHRGVPIELIEKRNAHLQQAITEKRIIEFEETLINKQGERENHIRRLNPVVDSNDEVQLIIGHGLNITELRKAQEEIIASEEKNTAILAAIPDLMFIISKEGIYMDMKNVDEKHLLVPKSQVIGSHISILLPEKLATMVMDVVQRVIASGHYEKVEYEINFEEGTRYYEGRLLKYSDNEVLAIIRDNSEERKAALEIKEKNEFIRQVIDTSPSLIFVKDQKGDFSLVNAECAKLFGKSIEEMVGISASSLYPVEAESQFYNTIDNQVITEGQEVRLEEKFTKPDGEEVWLSTIKKPLITSTGDLQILGISTNITEQRKAKQRLEESEELFRLLSENSKDLISLHEPNGQYIYVSKACKELLGYEPEELIGKLPLEILHPDDMNALENSLKANFLHQRKNVLVQHRLIRKDGSIQWVETNIKPILNTEGEIIRIQSAVRDISDRKLAEEAIKTNEKKYRDLIKYSPAFFCTHNMQGVLQEVNPYMLDKLGYTTEELVGVNLKTFLPKSHQIHFSSYLQEIIQKNLVEGIFTVLNKEKEARYLFYKNYKVEEQNTEPYIICIAQDITDRMHTEQHLKKAKEAAEESARIKENFLANMSHEIRTPMNGIMGMANLLGKSELNTVQTNYVKIISQSADNLLVIINDILDIAKIEAGKLELEEIPFNISDTVKSAFQTLIYKAQEKELTYQADPLQTEHQMLIGDPYRLNQVLLNLLNNAIKFTNTGSVTLSSRVIEETDTTLKLEFAVKDTGIGIPQDKIDYIFEGFSQAYSSTTRKYGGTGLGLSICRNLVEMQGGKIWVESQEDNGSTFKFEINYTKYTNTVYLSQAKETIDYNTLKGIKVLLCEDNEVNIFLAKSIMESWHMHVDVALNGRKAVEMSEKSTYDIILMDIQMPELSGLDATQLIRSNPDRIKSNVPIIALTANALKGDAEKYISVGMNDYISKPFDEKQLYLKIANTLLLNPVEKKPEPELSNKEQVNANSELLYDLSILHKMSRGNEAFIKRTKTLFIETVPQTISDINLYLQTQDWAGVSAAAHKLKSTIDTLRIEKLKEVIRQIENGAKSQNPQEAVESNIIYLNEIMAKVLEQMKADL